MRKLSYLFFILAILLSDVTCAVVSGTYMDMLCGMNHRGYSAGPDVAFIIGIPYVIGIIICILLGFFFKKKAERA